MLSPAGWALTLCGSRWACSLRARDQSVLTVGLAADVARVAIERPDSIRSWAIDVGGCLAPDYVWHDFAQVWQTPGAGESAIAGMLAIPVAERAAQYEALGMAPGIAGAVAAAADEAMGRCILALYRSAAQSAMARLGEQLGNAAARPGLVIIPTEDSYTGGERRARQAAEKAATKVAALPGLGHWWMLQDPRAGASGPTRVLVDSEGVSLGRFPSLVLNLRVWLQSAVWHASGPDLVRDVRGARRRIRQPGLPVG